MIAFVEPPIASTAVTALRNDPSVSRSDDLRSSQTASTMRRPVAAAIAAWRESTAGIDDAPGSVQPSASAALVIVDAVPIVMQWPGERAMPCCTSHQSRSVMVPARSSAQYFQVSDPDPSVSPRQFPRSIGPAGMKIAGRSIEIAPMMSAGVVLSQPPMSTAPSAGYERSTSSVSIARKFRYSIVVGFWNTSDNVMTGSSTGNPPACHTPRLTSSTRCLKCEWHGLMSLQVLRIAMTGLPA